MVKSKSLPGTFYVVFSEKGTVKDENKNGIWLRVVPEDAEYFVEDLKEVGQYREE
ncbi:MAG: hypothetical protein KGJ23_08040 [Euryarchaeota archaeon]|nr:hypothetical protein [Euryarchaeota archaeon]MDE1836551.1 hypothetical protein [Euryarchaeota archaeon]MDE1879254.1 hypothetical protein [Euryarchaeota archaeon]MDE2044521.1 hypothetical protein [Thermoplasmata archaeon]